MNKKAALKSVKKANKYLRSKGSKLEVRELVDVASGQEYYILASLPNEYSQTFWSIPQPTLRDSLELTGRY